MYSMQPSPQGVYKLCCISHFLDHRESLRPIDPMNPPGKQSPALPMEAQEAAAADAFLVKDGAIDYRGRPADKRKTGTWRACWPVIVNQIADTLSFFGIVSNIFTYMTHDLHQGTAQSARNINNWQGTLFLVSLFGAFMADTYWGRYWIVAFSYGLYCLGMVFLTLSVSLRSLRPPPCSTPQSKDFTVCPQPTSAQLGFFSTALYMIAVGSGSMKPCVSSFGADQFDETDPVERTQKISFFNWLIWGVNGGGFLAVTIMVYVQDNVGWSWGCGGFLISLAAATFLFFIVTTRYRYRKPAGSPLTRIAQVLVASMRKHNVKAPSDPTEFYEDNKRVDDAAGKRLTPHSNQFLFLDKAAVLTRKTATPWTLCPVTQVEETKLVLKMLPVWIATLWFMTGPSQATLFLRQGSTMNNRLGSLKIPPASMLVFSHITVLTFLPVYDHVLVPYIKQLTKNERGITLLQRIGLGMAFSILGLVIGAAVELKRLHVARHHESSATLPLTIFWLCPQYILMGFAEALCSVGLLEFFHSQAPETMQSLGIALSFANMGIGSFLSALLITLVNKTTSHRPWIQNDINKGRLDYFYWLVAFLSFLNLCFYILCASWYKYKGVAFNSDKDSENHYPPEVHQPSAPSKENGYHQSSILAEKQLLPSTHSM